MAGHSGRLDREPVRPEENYLATLEDENREMIGVEKKVEKMHGDKEKITAAAEKENDLSQERATGSAEEEGEEGREPVRARAPPQVSKDEREVHELTHTPYRSWCRHCVRARGRNMPHHSMELVHRPARVPKITMDYFFMSKADEQANENPVIVMVDEDTGEKYARAVGHKGIGQQKEMDWLIKDMSLELKAWGHSGGEGGHIIL